MNAPENMVFGPPARYCTNASHDWTAYGDGVRCICGRQVLRWIPNEGGVHFYEIHQADCR